MRPGRAPLQAAVALIVMSVVFFGTGGVAHAAPGTVAAAKPWHYWTSFVLVASTVGMFFMLFLGYLVKVVALKYGIRIGRKSAG